MGKRAVWDRIRKILKIVFVITVIGTVILTVTTAVVWMCDTTGDPDLDKYLVFALPFCMVHGALLLAVEYEIYFSVKYFLPGTEGRAVYKTVINAVCLFMLIFIVLLFVIASFVYLDIAVYASKAFSLWLCVWIVLRIVYAVVGAIRGNPV